MVVSIGSFPGNINLIQIYNRYVLDSVLETCNSFNQTNDKYDTSIQKELTKMCNIDQNKTNFWKIWTIVWWNKTNY